MKQRSQFGITLVVLSTVHLVAVAAEAPKPADKNVIPKGCVKLEDEIKFSGKNVYVSELGHLTAGKLAIAPLNLVDPTAADAIRGDNIKDLIENDSTLAKGEVTLGSVALAGDPAPEKFENGPFNPRSTISLQIQNVDDETANLSGSIKLTQPEIALIKLKNMNLKDLNAPFSVCGVGMQLYLSNGRKVITSGTVILYINNGSDKPIAIQALNNSRGKKAVGSTDTQMATSEDAVGVGSAL